MVFRATFIPTPPPPPARAKVSATRLAAQAEDPPPAQAPGLRPTALPATGAELPRPRTLGPTAIPSEVPQPVVPAPGPTLQASALPGIVRKPVSVDLDALAQRFPGLSATVLSLTQSLLAGVSVEGQTSAAWLAFGVPAQEVVSQLVKERLALMEASPARSATQHLTRLQRLLGEVLEALEGGFLRKPAHKVWTELSVEIRQLERLLEPAGPSLRRTSAQLEDLKARNQDAALTLQAHALALDWLSDRLPVQAGAVLLSRLAALRTAQALALEQVQTLALDQAVLQELSTLVQDGVLLQLPAVYSQLAGLSAKPSETQRFMAQEPLAELVSLIQRRT